MKTISEETLPEETIHEIFDILMETCGVKECQRFEFLPFDFTEFRMYTGKLGFGGKFWDNCGGWYVSCYREDVTDEISVMISAANSRLKILRDTIYS